MFGTTKTKTLIFESFLYEGKYVIFLRNNISNYTNIGFSFVHYSLSDIVFYNDKKIYDGEILNRYIFINLLKFKNVNVELLYFSELLADVLCSDKQYAKLKLLQK